MQIVEQPVKPTLPGPPGWRRVWSGSRLAAVARQAAARSEENSWHGLLEARASPAEPHPLLVLLTYCYLAGVLDSAAVPGRLRDDEALAFLRPRLRPTAGDIRRYRRGHRRALNDSLTHALLVLAGPDGAANPTAGTRLTFHHLEPFYLEARALVDRAVALDSMALDE